MKDKPKVVLKSTELKDHAAYSDARAKLEKLDLALAEASRRIEMLKLKINRASRGARLHITRAGVLFSAEQQMLEHLIARIIEIGSVPPEMVAKARRATPELGLDPSDMEMISEYRDAEGTEELLVRAITLQRREVLRQKKSAITEICEALRPERERIARSLAQSLLQFTAALREEISFIDRLTIQDAAIPDSLSPGPFPLTNGPTDPEAVRWLACTLGLSENDAKNWLGGELPGGTGAIGKAS